MKLTPSQLEECVIEYSLILPEEAKERIVISGSGLAYPLFGSSFFKFDYSNHYEIPADVSRKNLNAIALYSTAMQDYVDDAEQFARDCGFDLVYLSAIDKLISLDFDHNDSPLRDMGVGKIPVTSARKVEKFCQMIKSGHERFEKRYYVIKGLAEKLGSS